MRRALASLLFLIALAPGVAEGREFHKIVTKSGDTYYPMRLSMYLTCPGEVPRHLSGLTRLVGENEQQGSWDSLPNFFMEWDNERDGYVLLSEEKRPKRPETREVLGYADIPEAYRGSSCRHYMKVEALGGVNRNVLLSRIAWPIVVRGQ